jgi:hypothetical protein
MMVGEHIALGAEDHAGAEAGLGALARRAETVAEETPEQGVVSEGDAPAR